MKPARALIIATSHSSLGDTPERTGAWMGCLASAYWGLRGAAIEVDIASMRGGPVPIDARSIEVAGSNAPSVERFMSDPRAQRAMARSSELPLVDPAAYGAVVLPGGHGCLWDQAADLHLGRTIESILDAGGTVAAICHGVAGLLAPGASGKPVLAGRKSTGFTLREEQTVGLETIVPFILEQRVREVAASFTAGRAFEPFMVRDASLITGQNPASARPVIEELVATLLSLRAGSPDACRSTRRTVGNHLPSATELR